MDTPERLKTLDSYLRTHASQNPETLAVVSECRQLSYSELNKLVEHWASLLILHVPDVQRSVAVHVEDKLDAFIVMLALYRASLVYVPIDSSLPDARKNYIIADSQIDFIITDKADVKNWIMQGLNTFCLDSGFFDSAHSDLQVRTARTIVAPPNDELVAYVLYTSGSTGKPKGVPMPSRAIINLIDYQLSCGVGLEKALPTLQFASLGFDVSCQEVLSSIASGSTLFIAPSHARKDFSELISYLARHKISRVFLPYSVLQTLAVESECNEAASDVCLKQVVTAGEQLLMTKEIVSWLTEMDCQLINHYGPTETHVVTTFTMDQPLNTWPYKAPIGKPITNVSTYVLDEQRQPVPIGSVGMLYVSGVCLARGYINLPEAQSERFVFLRSPDGSSVRAYMTGDLVRLESDGNLVYEGRKDTQVKLNGHRVELDEVESVLKANPEVKEAIARVVRFGSEPGSVILIAFLLLKNSISKAPFEIKELQVSACRAWCDKLPDYMVPKRFFIINHIPLTTNGKVDYVVLEQAAFTDGELPVEHFTEDQYPVAEIFYNLLRCNNILPESNFFELGGNSLLAVKFVKMIEQVSGVKINFSSFLRRPTIEHVASLVNREKV